MAKRRVLVIDNDNEFLDMVRNILTPYGFEIQLAESDDDSVRMIKALRPDAVFISIEISKKSRLALCSKAKKAVGSQIPVILVTTTLTKSEIELHSKQRYHADAYLEKHELSSEQLYEQIEGLIGLNSNNVHMSTIESDATDSEHELFTSNGGFNMESVDVDNDAINSDKNDFGADNVDEPLWLRELFEKVIDDSAEDTTLDASQTKFSIDKLLEDDWENHNDLEQEKEINQLRGQLDEARREARSSPFSSDYLRLREDASQKGKEIGHLKKKLNDHHRKLVASEERLRELAKRLLSVQTELDQKKSREEELALEHKAAQTELAKLNTAFEESRKHYDSKVEKLKAEHRSALEKIEGKHKATIESFKKILQAEKDKKKADLKAELQKELKNIHKEHEAHIAEIKAEYDDEIVQLKSNNYKEIKEFEAKLEQLQSDNQESLRRIKGEHQKEVDALKKQTQKEKENYEALAKAELKKEIEKIGREHDELVSKLGQKHTYEIAELKSAIDDSQKGADTKIESLIKDHEATLKRVEEEYRSEIASLKTQIQEEKRDAVSADKAELQQELERIQREHKEVLSRLKEDHKEEITKLIKSIEDLQKKLWDAGKQYKKDLEAFDKKYKSDLHDLDLKYSSKIGKLKKEKNAEIKAFKQKAAEDAQKAAERLAQEQHAHEKTRIDLECRIANLLVKTSKQ